MTKLLLSSLLLASVVHATEVTNTDVTASGIVPVTSNTRDAGWYAGVGAGVLNWGGSFEADISNSTITHNGDVEDSPILLKVGYITGSENRVELYFKKDAVDTDGGSVFLNGEKFKTSTLGINYQWGISSLSSDKILPFIRVGLGFGSSTSSLQGYDDGSVVEFDLAGGVHYTVAKNIDLSVDIYRRAIGVTVTDNTLSSSDLVTVEATNGIEIGVNYHF